VPKLKPSACASDCTIPWPTEGLDPEEVVAEAHHQRPQPRRQCSRKAAKKNPIVFNEFFVALVVVVVAGFLESGTEGRESYGHH